MGKNLKFLTKVFTLIALMALTAIPALAAAPAFTSATYNVGTGELIITGTNLVAVTGLKNDINLAKIAITDSVSNSYTLTSGSVEIASPTSVTATLNDKDKAALAGFLDKNGTAALNSGTYQINIYDGWNGSTSSTSLGAHALTVSGVASLSSATYDITTGKLVITGSNLASNATESKSDIFPKYFTITDSSSQSYTLTTNTVVKLSDSTTAQITLCAKDQAAVAAIFNKNGTKTVGDTAYNLVAAPGWNGTGSIGSYAAHPITVSNYAAPTVTLNDSSVTYGSAITTKGNGLVTDKVGYIYIIPSATDLTDATQSDLDALVTAKTALKATVTNPANISIPTKTATFTFTGTTANYKAVAVDLAGTLSTASSGTLTINNAAAPSLTATVAKGTTEGTTKITATAGAGNSLYYKISSASVDTPILNTDVSSIITDKTLTALTSGDEISGVDATTNKYIAVYEVNSDKKVVKFKLITLSSTTISAGVAAAPSSIVLAVGSTTPVGGVTNVAIPAAGATDTTGKVTGWAASTANKIKFTVTDNGGKSTIKINNTSYTSGADYAITAASNLTIVVTTTQTGKASAVRTFTVSVTAAPTANVTYALTTPAEDTNNTITVSQANKTVAVAVENATASVVITGAKTAAQTVTIGGNDASDVTAGGTATAPTYTVDTSDIKTDGGSKTFTLAVAETGKGTITYTVTVTVAAPESGG